MKSWLITIPKTIKWEDYAKEIAAVADGDLVMNYRTRYFPNDMKIGDRCYLLWNGRVRGWRRLSDWLISRDVGFAKRREKYGPPASISKGAGHSIKWTDPQCKGSVEYGDMGMTDKEKLQVCVQALRDVTDPLGRIKRDLREGEKFASSAIVIAQSPLFLQDIAKEALREIGANE